MACNDNIFFAISPLKLSVAQRGEEGKRWRRCPRFLDPGPSVAGLAAEAGMRLAGVLLPPCSAVCQADADTLEQAVSASLARQDYRLIVRAGRGEVAPGIAADQQAAAKARCGVRYLDGFGDVIKPDQKEAHAGLSAYAADYNRRMLAHCPPVDGKR